MARMLSRSKSLRLLRGGQKETHQQDSDHFTPPPVTFQLDPDRLKAATLVTRTRGRAETPDVVQRPRTSSVPVEHGKLFHRKVAPVTPDSQDAKHNLQLPSPEKSTTTLLYTAEIHEDTEGVIGIALGSPTMNPPWNTTPNGTELGTVTHISSNLAPLGAVEASQGAPKPKISRWKSIFGRKTPAPQAHNPSFYQLAQPVIPPRADSHHDEETLQFESWSVCGAVSSRDGTRSVSPPIFRHEIRESRRLPKGQDQPIIESRSKALTSTTITPSKSLSSLIRSASSPKPPPKHSWSQSPSIPQIVEPRASQKSPVPTIGGGSLLDVEIPSVKLDRYSVMFGNLLQSDSNSSSNRSSSLLLRRQGNTERLKPLNELSPKKDDNESRNLKQQRRATSPAYPKSPGVAFSLFPPTTEYRVPSPRSVSVHRPRPLQRSKTAPANSPHRTRFPISDETSDGETEEVSQEKARHELPKTEEGDVNRQILTPTPSSPHSFDSDSDSEEIASIVGASPGEPWKPLLSPQWEIVNQGPPKTAALRSHPTKSIVLEQGPYSAPLESAVGNGKSKRLEARVEPASHFAHRSPLTKPILQAHQSELGIQTTTVGVARSVSVSRASPRSADVLKPNIVRRATEKTLSPASGRFIDQKPLTPTLVELKHRKSQRVELESA